LWAKVILRRVKENGGYIVADTQNRRNRLDRRFVGLLPAVPISEGGDQKIHMEGFVIMTERDQQGTSSRGFAAMDQQKQRDIASKGGQASGGNFKNDRERAAEAGRKGGQNVPPNERSFARDPRLAAEAGRRGGEHGRGGAGFDPRSAQPIGARHPPRAPRPDREDEPANEPEHASAGATEGSEPGERGG
jgi:uncharacterized protein